MADALERMCGNSQDTESVEMKYDVQLICETGKERALYVRVSHDSSTSLKII